MSEPLWSDERMVDALLECGNPQSAMHAMRDDYERRIAELERVPPAVPEPDWSRAPEMATHHLYNGSGVGWFVERPSWGEIAPIENSTEWIARYLKPSGLRLPTPDWRGTLTVRPDTEPTP